MKRINIHSSNEDRLSANTESTILAVNDVHKELKDLHKTTKDKSVEMDGFVGVIKSNQKTAKNIDSLGERLDPSKLIKKVDEVKSAQLIANQELKKISKKEFPQPKDFPTKIGVTLEGISVVTLKGDKGDAPTKEELVKILKPFIPAPEKGDAGKDYVLTAKDKKDIAASIKIPVIEKVIEKTTVNQPIITHETKEVAVGDEPDVIVEKINESKKIIDAERVRGLTNVIHQLETIGSNPQGKEAGGGGNVVRYLSNGVVISAYVTEINFSSNITPVYDGNGRITLTATGGGSTTYSETPTGLINGSNKVYTVLHNITTVINFAINGQYIHPADYSVTTNTITFVTALDATLSGLGFTIVYQ